MCVPFAVVACMFVLAINSLPAQASTIPASTGVATQTVFTSQVSAATPVSASSAPVAVASAAVIATALSATTAAATTYCKSAWAQENELDGLGITLYSFRLTTNWCYNGSTVTSHSSSISANVSGTGEATGWSYDSSSQSLSFNCYSANGKSCSGNHELAQVNFDALLGSVCIAQVSEDETYNGGFSYSGQGC